MSNRELIEKVLKRPADYWTDDYLNRGFREEFELIKKIYDFLGEDEFSLLYESINGDCMSLFRIIAYFEDGNK